MAVRYTGATVRKFGWRRVAKNFMRLGWRLTDADEVTTYNTDITRTTYQIDGKDYVNEEAKTTSKKRVELSFVRDSSWYTNLPAIFIFELLFTIIFNVRRIIGFFLPILGGIALLIGAMGGSFKFGEFDNTTPFLIVFFIVIIWMVLMLLESLTAFIASKILRER